MIEPEVLAAYRKGVVTGVMKSATPNVVRSLLDEIDRLLGENKALRQQHADIVGSLYGQGFDVLGWHLNGALEPLDSWFDDNGWCEPATVPKEKPNDPLPTHI